MAEQRRPTWSALQAELIARAWKDQTFRQELVQNPKAVLQRELAQYGEGIMLAENLDVQVLEQPPSTLYVVLPPAPVAAERELSDEELESAVGGAATFTRCGCSYETANWCCN